MLVLVCAFENRTMVSVTRHATWVRACVRTCAVAGFSSVHSSRGAAAAAALVALFVCLLLHAFPTTLGGRVTEDRCACFAWFFLQILPSLVLVFSDAVDGALCHSLSLFSPNPKKLGVACTQRETQRKGETERVGETERGR